VELDSVKKWEISVYVHNKMNTLEFAADTSDCNIELLTIKYSVDDMGYYLAGC
jgi:hypothetical protein